MPTRDFYEGVWESVPEGLEPPAFELRRAFLLECLRAVGGVNGDRHAGAGAGRDPGVDRDAATGAGSDRALRVLDVGCGEGRFAAEITRAGAHVIGVDVAAEPLRRARAHHPELDLRLVDPDGPLPFSDSEFDLVWAGETIEHVADTAGWLSELRRVLRSQGSLVLSTPGHDRLTMLGLALSPRSLDAHFDPRSDHIRFYTRRTLVALLEDFSFHDVRVRSAGGLAAGRRLLLAEARRSRF